MAPNFACFSFLVFSMNAYTQLLVNSVSTHSTYRRYNKMTVIPLKAQFVSLIITLVFALSEFLTLYCLGTANALSESCRLRRGAHINLKSHLWRSRLFVLICLLMFIAFEAVVSHFSEPVQTPVVESHDCVLMDTLSSENGTQDLNIRVDILETQCVKVDNSSFTQLGGNVSMLSRNFSCSDTPIFKVEFAWIAEFSKVTGAGKTIGCHKNNCVLTFKEGDFTYSSLAFDVSFTENMMNASTQIDFIRTFVLYETEPLLEVIAERGAKALGQDRIGDPYEARRRMFAGSRYTKCPMKVSTVAETSIPNAILAFVAAVFVLSVLLAGVCIGTRKRRFARLSDPLQWACRTFRHGEHQKILTSPVVRCEKRDEGIVFVVDDLNTLS